jgi:hypothetical protein
VYQQYIGPGRLTLSESPSRRIRSSRSSARDGSSGNYLRFSRRRWLGATLATSRQMRPPRTEDFESWQRKGSWKLLCPQSCALPGLRCINSHCGRKSITAIRSPPLISRSAGSARLQRLRAAANVMRCDGLTGNDLRLDRLAHRRQHLRRCQVHDCCSTDRPIASRHAAYNLATGMALLAGTWSMSN